MPAGRSPGSNRFGCRQAAGRTGADLSRPALASAVTGDSLTDASASDGGTYILLVALDRPATVTFGAAGDRDLTPGTYAYAGSALGSGGFARVERHRELAAGDRGVRHWHVDHLLGHPATSVVGDVRTGGDHECAVAAALRDRATPVSGVGASDCDCSTHLVGPPTDAPTRAVVARVHDSL